VDEVLSGNTYSLREHPAKCVAFQIGGSSKQSHGEQSVLTRICWI